MEFRLVHPKNQETQGCELSEEIDRSNYECLRVEKQDGTYEAFWVARKVQLSGDSLKSAEVREVTADLSEEFTDMLAEMGIIPEGKTALIQLVFDEQGSKQLEKLTTDHVKRRIAVVLDGKLLTVAVIFEPITSG